jgi:hypothetical protein
LWAKVLFDEHAPPAPIEIAADSQRQWIGERVGVIQVPHGKQAWRTWPDLPSARPSRD